MLKNDIKVLETIQNTKTECLNINKMINKTIKELDWTNDFDKNTLRKIRDENIKTIQLINQMELTELITIYK